MSARSVKNVFMHKTNRICLFKAWHGPWLHLTKSSGQSVQCVDCQGLTISCLLRCERSHFAPQKAAYRKAKGGLTEFVSKLAGRADNANKIRFCETCGHNKLCPYLVGACVVQRELTEKNKPRSHNRIANEHNTGFACFSKYLLIA